MVSSDKLSSLTCWLAYQPNRIVLFFWNTKPGSSFATWQNSYHLVSLPLIPLFFPDPSWASVNRGTFLCDECCSVHRSLGRHISQVRHLKHTPWPPTLLQVKNKNSPQEFKFLGITVLATEITLLKLYRNVWLLIWVEVPCLSVL